MADERAAMNWHVRTHGSAGRARYAYPEVGGPGFLPIAAVPRTGERVLLGIHEYRVWTIRWSYPQRGSMAQKLGEYAAIAEVILISAKALFADEDDDTEDDDEAAS